jgi:hypothetical protein
MEHLGEYYYVALLSAAELHGAAGLCSKPEVVYTVNIYL